MASEESGQLRQAPSANDALNMERDQFAFAERAARFGFWRVRLSDNSAMLSPGLCRLLGIPEDTAPGIPELLARLSEEDAANTAALVINAIRTCSPFHCRSRVRNPSTAAKIIDVHGEVAIGADGRAEYLVGVCTDVTEQVTAEEARAKAEEMHRMLTEQSTDIIMLHTRSGQVTFASHALERILGLTPRDFDEGGFLKFVHPDDREEASKLDVIPLPGETLRATYRVRHANGHYVWIEATTRGVYDDCSGEFRHIIGVSRDICERKEQEFAMQAARESAEAASRAKSGFLAGMSHELRTPLNAILGFADIMRDELYGEIGDPRYREYAGLIFDSGQHLLDLISDILDMAKIEAGKTELHFEPVDLAGTIEDCARLLAERARNAGVELITEVPETGIPLTADGRAIKQIVLNLLSNAVKFTPRGGHVWTTATAESGRVILRVRDDGIGIPAEALPRLGRAFEQVTTDANIAKGGTGLGLALVRALAEKHDGSMTIESIEGEGTTVTINLAQAPAALVAEAA
jgi:PAS domain S-box-containing protein